MGIMTSNGYIHEGDFLYYFLLYHLFPAINCVLFSQHPQFIADILKWRANTTENHEILTLLNSKGQVAVSLTCSQLHKKAERVGVLLLEKGHINTGDHVALIYPPGVDLIAAFYGCLYVGAVPVTIRPPHPQNLQSTVNTVRTVVEVSKSVIILSTMSVIKLLKSKVSRPSPARIVRFMWKNCTSIAYKFN